MFWGNFGWPAGTYSAEGRADLVFIFIFWLDESYARLSAACMNPLYTSFSTPSPVTPLPNEQEPFS